MSSQYVVAMTDPHRLPVTDAQRDILAEIGAAIIAEPCHTADDVAKFAGDAHGIICSVAPITREVMERCRSLRVVARTGIGYDTVDIQAATDLGVCVANVPGFCVDEVADSTLAVILALWRKIVPAVNACRQGRWDRDSLKPIRRIRGNVLGIVGFGQIGRAVAERAAAFGFRVIYHDPYVEPVAGEPSVGLDELLRAADVVSLHTPLTDQTRGLIDESALRAMKPTAYLVNFARGPVVDNGALARAVREGRIAGAAVDVVDKEPPPPDDPLLSLDNVLVTPHFGGYSQEAFDELRERCATQVAQVLTGRFPDHLVNDDVRPKLKGELE